MRYRLVPGLLSEQPIEYDDVHHRLMVGLYLVPLSTTQYLLVMALLRQRKRWKESHGQEPLFVSVSHLMRLACVTKQKYIKQHMYRASESLAQHQIVIGCLYGRGYGIFAASEVPPLAPVGEGEEACLMTFADV